MLVHIHNATHGLVVQYISTHKKNTTDIQYNYVMDTPGLESQHRRSDVPSHKKGTNSLPNEKDDQKNRQIGGHLL